ncbi:MAG: hypothetical protein JWL90_4627 [Chthoniobacteraceae bacterium]|nr:hypothetical protein [Chthoniobacteraceae bacterium]
MKRQTAIAVIVMTIASSVGVFADDVDRLVHELNRLSTEEWLLNGKTTADIVHETWQLDRRTGKMTLRHYRQKEDAEGKELPDKEVTLISEFFLQDMDATPVYHNRGRFVIRTKGSRKVIIEKVVATGTKSMTDRIESTGDPENLAGLIARYANFGTPSFDSR